MKKFKIKYIYLLIFFLIGIVGSAYFYFSKEKKPIANPVPKMTVTVLNENDNYTANPFGPTTPYPVSFLKIKSVSFAKENGLLFINFKLMDTLPKNDKDLPSFDGDKLIGASFNVDIKQNYYDSLGRKNPTEADARIKISFYGDSDQDDSGNKVIVNGNLVDGGPGSDYFTVSYPYDQLIFNPDGDEIVASAWSNGISKAFTASVGMSQLENSEMSVDKDDPKQIGIRL